MSTYYLHDGRNEVGPFTIDLLKKQKLTRNTPLRQTNTDKWMPAEKLADLKPLLVPQKIRRPKDIVPVVAGLHRRKPRVLYGAALGVALLAGLSFYSLNDSSAANDRPETAAAVQASEQTLQAANTVALPPSKAGEKKVVAKTTAADDAAKASRQQWRKLISAANSNYGIGLLGGIKNLEVIITNRTDYPIDQAVAKVTYIKANGEVWKTKLITLYGIPAHDSKDQSVPDVGRGKKVTVSLRKVISKKMKFSYTEGQQIKNPEDPYVL